MTRDARGQLRGHRPGHTNINKQFLMPNIQPRRQTSNIPITASQKQISEWIISLVKLRVFQVIILSFSDRGNYLFNWQMSLREHLCDVCLDDVWLVIVNTSQCGQLWMCIVLTMMYRDWWHSISPLTLRDSGPHHAKFRFKRHKRQKYVHTLSPSHQAPGDKKGDRSAKLSAE